jgi:hypothetical protein
MLYICLVFKDQFAQILAFARGFYPNLRALIL